MRQRLTAVQAQLYDLLKCGPEPASAYQLMDQLNQAGRARVYPQTVYRALTRLQALGLVHRVESSNAYLACRAPAQPHRCIHLLCDRCGNAEELIDTRISGDLEADAEQRHFLVQRQIVELHGVCRHCASQGMAT